MSDVCCSIRSHLPCSCTRLLHICVLLLSVYLSSLPTTVPRHFPFSDSSVYLLHPVADCDVFYCTTPC